MARQVLDPDLFISWQRVDTTSSVAMANLNHVNLAVSQSSNATILSLHVGDVYKGRSSIDVNIIQPP